MHSLYKCFLLILLFFPLLNSYRILAQHTELPTDFRGNLIIVQPVTSTGDTQRYFLDTGGLYSLSKKGNNQLRMMNRHLNPLPGFVPENSIPGFPDNVHSNSESAGTDPLTKFNPYDPSRLMLYYSGEGVLGQDWLAGRSWTVDYPDETASYHDTPGNGPITQPRIPLYFQQYKMTDHHVHLPQIEAVVDGDTLRFLLDTGATVILKDLVHQALGDRQPRIRATSYISRSQFEEWYFSHPEWKIYEDVEEWQTSNMIRVPEISIAGQTVGPVWFTTRPDYYFSTVLLPYTDTLVSGTLGGSALKYFRVTVNYAGEYVIFEKSD